MKGVHVLAFAGVAMFAGLVGCSSSPGKPESTAQASAALEKPFRVTGNEPFWHIIVEPGQLVLERPGQPTEELLYGTVARSETGHRFRASREGLSIELVTAPQLCRDSMTGMPHPLQARLFMNGEPLSGCGGDPKRLIMGAEWAVEYIDGHDVVDKSRPTVQFLEDGRIAGMGSCNGYTGSWLITGETLEVGALASTRKACEPALMDQENRFLRQLESTRGFDIGPRGELLISSDDGALLRAARAGQ